MRELKTKLFFHSIFKPKVIILSFTLLHFLSVTIYVLQGISFKAPGADTELFLIRPIILLVSAISLWLGKLWNYILSFCLSIWFVFGLANSDFPFASEIYKTPFGINIFAAIQQHEYVEHSQTPFQLLLFSVIACYSAFSILHFLLRYSDKNSPKFK